MSDKKRKIDSRTASALERMDTVRNAGSPNQKLGGKSVEKEKSDENKVGLLNSTKINPTENGKIVQKGLMTNKGQRVAGVIEVGETSVSSNKITELNSFQEFIKATSTAGNVIEITAVERLLIDTRTTAEMVALQQPKTEKTPGLLYGTNTKEVPSEFENSVRQLPPHLRIGFIREFPFPSDKLHITEKLYNECLEDLIKEINKDPAYLDTIIRDISALPHMMAVDLTELITKAYKENKIVFKKSQLTQFLNAVFSQERTPLDIDDFCKYANIHEFLEIASKKTSKGDTHGHWNNLKYHFGFGEKNRDIIIKTGFGINLGYLGILGLYSDKLQDIIKAKFDKSKKEEKEEMKIILANAYPHAFLKLMDQVGWNTNNSTELLLIQNSMYNKETPENRLLYLNDPLFKKLLQQYDISFTEELISTLTLAELDIIQNFDGLPRATKKMIADAIAINSNSPNEIPSLTAAYISQKQDSNSFFSLFINLSTIIPSLGSSKTISPETTLTKTLNRTINKIKNPTSKEDDRKAAKEEILEFLKHIIDLEDKNIIEESEFNGIMKVIQDAYENDIDAIVDDFGIELIQYLRVHARVKDSVHAVQDPKKDKGRLNRNLSLLSKLERESISSAQEMREKLKDGTYPILMTEILGFKSELTIEYLKYEIEEYKDDKEQYIFIKLQSALDVLKASNISQSSKDRALHNLKILNEFINNPENGLSEKEYIKQIKNELKSLVNNQKSSSKDYKNLLEKCKKIIVQKKLYSSLIENLEEEIRTKINDITTSGNKRAAFYYVIFSKIKPLVNNRALRDDEITELKVYLDFFNNSQFNAIEESVIESIKLSIQNKKIDNTLETNIENLLQDTNISEIKKLNNEDKEKYINEEIEYITTLLTKILSAHSEEDKQKALKTLQQKLSSLKQNVFGLPSLIPARIDNLERYIRGLLGE